MSLIDNFGPKAGSPKAAVGANPNIAELMRSTANSCASAGCDSAPPVAVGLILRETPQGAPVAYPYTIAPETKAYLTVALDVDFKGDDLYLSSASSTLAAGFANGNPLDFLKVTSWTSNGIRDQNLLAGTGIPASAFNYQAQRRFGFDVAPTQARQQIVIEIENTMTVAEGGIALNISGMVAGVCGDCNTSKR